MDLFTSRFLVCFKVGPRMITCVYAQIRGGKSYTAVEKYLLPAVKKGRNIYTNIPLVRRYWDMINEECVHQVSAQTLVEMMYLELEDLEGKSLKLPFNSLVVLDEAQMFFDRQGTQKKTVDLKRVYTFLQLCGHFNIDVVFICQDVGQLDLNIKSVCTEFVHIINGGIFGMGSLAYANVHQTYKGPKMCSFPVVIRPEIYNLYQSIAHAASHENTRRPVAFGVVLPIVIIPILALIVIFFARKGFKSIAPVPPPINRTVPLSVSSPENSLVKSTDSLPASGVDLSTSELVGDTADFLDGLTRSEAKAYKRGYYGGGCIVYASGRSVCIHGKDLTADDKYRFRKKGEYIISLSSAAVQPGLVDFNVKERIR